MFRDILVVCTGNICRSPVGAGFLGRALEGRSVGSAGIAARTGEGVEATARALAEADGLDLSDHVARRLTPELVGASDLILVMSERQRRSVASMSPEALGKTLLFGRWLDDDAPNGVEIPDPYGRSPEVFRLVHDQLKRASGAWIARLA